MGEKKEKDENEVTWAICRGGNQQLGAKSFLVKVIHSRAPATTENKETLSTNTNVNTNTNTLTNNNYRQHKTFPFRQHHFFQENAIHCSRKPLSGGQPSCKFIIGILPNIQIINHKDLIHDKEDDENQSINQKPMCVENLENDHNMRDQSGSYDNYQGDNYEHHQGVNNDKLVKN